MEQHQCADDTSEDRPQVISLLLQECRRIQRLSLKSGDNIDTAATYKRFVLPLNIEWILVIAKHIDIAASLGTVIICN